MKLKADSSFGLSLVCKKPANCYVLLHELLGKVITCRVDEVTLIHCENY